MKRSIAVTCSCFLLTTFTPIAAAKATPLDAPDPGRGIIGVSVKVIPPARMGSSSCEVVYFVRVVEDADRFGSETLINSSYADGRDVYLLNADPGRYVAIGCKLAEKPGTPAPGVPVAPGVSFGIAFSPGPATVVFSEKDILQTEVDVRAGAAAFMGAINVQSSTKTGESDHAQTHYLHMLSAAPANQSAVARAFSGHPAYIATFKGIERGTAAETEFWDESIEQHFTKEPAWTARIAHRSSAPVVGAAGATAPAAILSSDEFVSSVCIDVNTVKARASGNTKEAPEIARMVCQTVMTNWNAQGCPQNPSQDPCKKRLASFDGSLKSSGSSMLFATAQAGQVSLCSVLLDMGLDPNATISTGWTPLMVAAAGDKPDIVKLLLEKGASLTVKNADGKTAASIAAESGRTAIVEMLAKASGQSGADQ
jgi:hypothetical protein